MSNNHIKRYLLLVFCIAIIVAVIIISRTCFRGSPAASEVWLSYEVIQAERSSKAIELPRDHDIVGVVHDDVMFLSHFYAAMSRIDLDTIESGWNVATEDNKVLAHYHKECAINERSYTVTAEVFLNTQYRTWPSVKSRMTGFHVDRGGREYSMTRCGFHLYPCDSNESIWKGYVYDKGSRVRTYVFFRDERIAYCTLEMPTQNIYILYNGRGVITRILQVGR